MVKPLNHKFLQLSPLNSIIKEETRGTESSLFRLQLTRYDVATLDCAHTLGG